MPRLGGSEDRPVDNNRTRARKIEIRGRRSRHRLNRGGATMSSVNDQLKTLADDFAAKRISRRELWKGAAALGLTGMWIAALERGALAGPAPLRSEIRSADQDRATTLII